MEQHIVLGKQRRGGKLKVTLDTEERARLLGTEPMDGESVLLKGGDGMEPHGAEVAAVRQ